MLMRSKQLELIADVMHLRIDVLQSRIGRLTTPARIRQNQMLVKTFTEELAQIQEMVTEIEEYLGRDDTVRLVRDEVVEESKEKVK